MDFYFNFKIDLESILLATKLNDTAIFLDENYESDYNNCFRKSFVQESNFKNLQTIEKNNPQDYILNECLQFLK